MPSTDNKSSNLTILDIKTIALNQTFSKVSINGKGKIPTNIEITYDLKSELTNVHFKILGKNSTELNLIEQLHAEIVDTTLYITAISESNKSNFFRNMKLFWSNEIQIKVILSKRMVDALYVDLQNGSCKLTGMDVTGDCQVVTPVGTIELDEMNLGSLVLKSAAGKVSLNNSKVLGDTRLETAAGKVYAHDISVVGTFIGSSLAGRLDLQNIVAKHIQAQTASGSISIDASGFESIKIDSAAGSIKSTLNVTNQVEPRIKFGVASGSISSQIKGFQGSWNGRERIGYI
ncbi:hypothetical protein BC833DRAFT_567620 [Globomyces pollinis-pini]|nr:hypothetical protein BC833DRAFT_567620 [Globomyces pollinis-pini]